MKSKLVEALEPRLLKSLDALVGRTISRACSTGWRGQRVGLLFEVLNGEHEGKFCVLEIDPGYESGDSEVVVAVSVDVYDLVSLGLVTIEEIDAEDEERDRIEAINREVNDRRMYETLKARFEHLPGGSI